MILRRFTQHVTDQNWFAVGLDVIVVITGIFLGMQVAEWNEERKERMLEQQYLERLLTDMQTSDKLQKGQILRLDRIIPGQLQALNILLSGILKPEDKPTFEIGLKRTGISARPLTQFGTIDELQSTGRVLILRDPAIRQAISGLRQSYTMTNDMMKNVQLHFASMSIILNRYIIYPLIGGDIIYDFDTLVRDKEYISAISINNLHMQFLRNALQDHNGRTVEIIDQLKAAVDNSSPQGTNQ